MDGNGSLNGTRVLAYLVLSAEGNKHPKARGIDPYEPLEMRGCMTIHISSQPLSYIFMRLTQMSNHPAGNLLWFQIQSLRATGGEGVTDRKCRLDKTHLMFVTLHKLDKYLHGITLNFYCFVRWQTWTLYTTIWYPVEKTQMEQYKPLAPKHTSSPFAHATTGSPLAVGSGFCCAGSCSNCRNKNCNRQPTG